MIILISMRRTNIIYVRADRYPELPYELKKMMAELNIDSYAELLKIVVDLYRENPLLFKDFVSGRKLKFIGLK